MPDAPTAADLLTAGAPAGPVSVHPDLPPQPVPPAHAGFPRPVFPVAPPEDRPSSRAARKRGRSRAVRAGAAAAARLAGPFRRKPTPVGGGNTAPGTVTDDPTAPVPVLTGVGFGLGPKGKRRELVEVPLTPGEVPAFLDAHPVSWVNVDGLGDARVLQALGETFGLHPLELEDVTHTHQRAKCEEYPDHLFVVADMARPGPPGEDGPNARPTFAAEQVSFFLGEGWVLTFQERPGDSFDSVRDRLRQKRGRIRDRGADYLFYALIDALLDAYFPVVESLGDRLEELDEQIADRSGRGVVQRLHRLRGELLVIRKVLWPHREMTNALLRERPLVSDETRVFLRDAHDHAQQLLELAETYRELCSDLRDFHYAQVNTQSGEVSKVLTIVGTIFIPLSFIAGLWGMNFDSGESRYNMPELHWAYGYPAALTLMAAIAAGLLVFFWRMGWLRREE